MGKIVELNVCKTHDELNDVVQRKPDLVILASKYMGIKDEDDIWLSEYFEKNNINYSGSSSETLKFDFDNILAKSYLRNKGFNTTKYFTATPGEYKSTFSLPIGYPLLLKPMDAANSNATDVLSPVTDFEDFEKKVIEIKNHLKNKFGPQKGILPIVIVIFLLVIGGYSSMYEVDTEETGGVLRFGKF